MKLSLAIILLGCASAQAGPIFFQSSERETSLLELYTSEGCSSCPPAERWLSTLKNDRELWKEFVPVAFHVDYWNNLGWRDRLSNAQFTMRQQNYSRVLASAYVYTPEFILNGQEWNHWQGFPGAPSAVGPAVGRLQASSTDGMHWQAEFTPAGTVTSDYEVTAAVLVSDLSSDVDAGENSGRHLNHDFAALSLITRPLFRETNVYQDKFVLDTNAKGKKGKLAVAVWVTQAGRLQALQATGGWLPMSGPN